MIGTAQAYADVELHPAPLLPVDPSLLLLTLILICTVLWDRVVRPRNRKSPPGPKALPIVGNILKIPTDQPWIGYRDLCAKYGDLVYFHGLGKSMLVLGSSSVMFEYLDKRSANTSDRPNWSPTIELTGADISFGVLPYGPSWKRQRRTFWQYFRPEAITRLRPAQRDMARRFLARLLEKPSDMKEHIRHAISGALLKVVYDIDVADENDPYIAKVQAAVDGASQSLVPGRFLIQYLPFLQYVPAWAPGAGFQRQFAEYRRASDELRDAPFARVRAAMERGDGAWCITKDLLTKIASSGAVGQTLKEEEEMAQNVGVVAFEGGSDTLSATMQNIFLAMSLYPDVLKKAHDELDTVVGPHRLPDYSDSESLVYVNAIMREALRWMPSLALAVPHATIADDEFQGYFIPAGTILLSNIWACLHDPEVYDHPEEFRPERFIRDGQLNPDVRDPRDFAFGFGRRICPGRYLAETSLFINVASVLHVFDITPPIDSNGVPITIQPRSGGGLVSYPEDCCCTIKPRSTTAEVLIRNASMQ